MSQTGHIVAESSFGIVPVAYSGKGGLRDTGESSRTAKVINDSLVASFKSCPRGGQVSSVSNVVSGIAHWKMNGDGRVLNGRGRIERATL